MRGSGRCSQCPTSTDLTAGTLLGPDFSCKPTCDGRGLAGRDPSTSSVGAKGLGRWPGAGREKGTYSRTALHRNHLYQPPKRWEKILRHPKTPSLCSFVAVALRDRHAALCVNLFLPEPALGSAPSGLFLLADLTSNLCALCFSDHASEKHCIKPGIVRDLKLKKKK